MKLFLAVLFFCTDGQCYFWKSTDLFYSEVKCVQSLEAASKELEAKGIPSQGSCMQINIRNNL